MDYNITYRKKNNGIQAIISYKEGLKWKQKSKQGFEDSRKGKMLAKQWALGAVNELEKNISTGINDKNMTFKEFTDMYIEHIKLTHSRNTIESYSNSLKHFESLNSKEIGKITPIDIEKCIDESIRKGRKNNSINCYLKCLSAIFNYAVKNDFILKNPIKNRLKAEKAKKTALTYSELEDLLSKIRKISYKYYIITLIAGKTGLRRGEILGLTWADVNKKYIDVNKQWKKDINGKWGFGKAKSKNSVRKVPISSNIYNELMNYKKSLKNININNRIIDLKTCSSIETHLRKNYKDCGYDISIHELRHTYTTLLIQNGLDFKTVAKLVGDDVEQVLKTYSHVNDDMMNRAENLINNIF